MLELTIDQKKAELRKKYGKIRESVSPVERIEFSKRISECIFAESKYVRAENVLIYNDYGSEVKTNLIFEKAIKDGKNVFYPKVEGYYMSFYKITDQEQLSGGYKGILEPFGNTRKYESVNHTIIIVPGTVFGKDGYRIGYGKGYYDRFLATFPSMYKIGICYDIQMCDTLPYDDYDIKMDEIISEKNIISLNGEKEARWVLNQ